MEICSDIVGARSKEVVVPLSPRQTMNYAAALGDNNPNYMDDAREGGICAPPMMAVALTWPLSSQFEIYWGDTEFPMTAQQRQVHYNESICWSRPIRPDENVMIQGSIISMVSHTSGTIITIRYDANGADGEKVFSEYISGLLRGVTLSDGGAEIEAPPVISDALEPSAREWSTSIAIDPLAAHVYDGCTDIIFPIHTSVTFARQVGLPDPIYQGTATLGLAVREILNREAEGDPARMTSVHCGFRGMVFPGTSVTLHSRVSTDTENGKVVHFDVLNADGVAAIRSGRVHLI